MSLLSRNSDEETIPQNVRTYRSFSQLFFNVVTICCGSLFFGYGIAYLSIFPIEQIRTEFKIDFSYDTTQSLFQGVVPLGALVGAGLSSIVQKYLSRRFSMIFVAFLGMLGGSLTLISSFIPLIIGRFIEGLCLGLYSSFCPLFINQLSPIQLKGLFGTLNQIFIVSGVVIANILALAVSDNAYPGAPITSGWRLIFAGPILIALVQAILLLVAYRSETPKYLLLMRRQDQAKDLIEKLYEPQYSDLIFQRMKQEVEPGLGKSILSQTDQQQSPTGSNNSIAIFMGFHLALLQQFSGINIIVVYGTPILRTIVGQDQLKLSQILLQAISLVGCLGAATLIKKLGRKTLLQIGALVIGILMATTATCYVIIAKNDSRGTEYVIIACLYLFMLVFGFTLGPVVWLYIPQILEPKYIPFTTLTNWAGCTVTVMLFPILKSAMGTQVYIFYFLAIWCLGSVGLGHFLLVETKGKSETDIALEYEQKCK